MRRHVGGEKNWAGGSEANAKRKQTEDRRGEGDGTRPFREKIPKSGSILTDCQASEVAGYVRDVNSFDSNNNNPRSRSGYHAGSVCKRFE